MHKNIYYEASTIHRARINWSRQTANVCKEIEVEAADEDEELKVVDKDKEVEVADNSKEVEVVVED
jgi:hypothetical protein